MGRSNEENGTLLPKSSKNATLKVVGGANFSEKKCLFSLDGKLLLAAAEYSINIYVITTRTPYGLLKIKPSGCRERITNIQLDPYSPECCLISFTNTGRVSFFDYLKVTLIKELDIFGIYADCGIDLTLLYGLAVKPIGDEDKANMTIYHATLAGKKPTIYQIKIKQIEKIATSRNHSQNQNAAKSFSRLKSTATNIRFDTERALVGIVVGARNKFLATIDGNFINIIHLPYSPSTGGIAHKQTRNMFTCLTAHPQEYLLAAGDSLGRVHIYREDFCSAHQPIKSIMHWHHSPVADLCFSPSGSYLYSGGFESVLVRWDVSFSHNNNFYPRLGSPIRFIVCDHLNQKIFTCHEDNSSHIVSSTMDSSFPALTGLTLLPPTDFLRAPQNISWDLKSSSVVLRGKCGHLQFYSPFKEQQLYQLDVVNMNYLPPEVDKIIVNVDVTRFCVSPNSEWISTLDYREDGIMMPEMRLKFWQFLETSDKKYNLNTFIHLPHKKPVNCMRFSQDSNFMITTSKDSEFKIWHLVNENQDKPGAKVYWICGRVGNINRTIVPEAIAASSDFSLLAISFGSNTTIWDTSELNLNFKGTFIPPKDVVDQNLLSIDFGTGNQSHLLSETRSSSFRVWDLLTLSVVQLWKPQRNTYIKFSFFDERTNRIACYLTNGTITLLDMEKVIGKINLFHETADVRLMVCGTFFPLPQYSNHAILSQSGIILIDQSQKVYAIGLEDIKVDEIKLEQSSDDEEESLTPFAQMLKAETFRIKKEEKLQQLEINEYLGPATTRKKLIEDLFVNVPSHVLPPVDVFCTSFLTSLLQLTSSTSYSENQNEMDNRPSRVEVSSEEESDEENKVKQTKEHQSMEIDDEDEKKFEFVFSENYDWLKV